jgi:hypothetical protein
MALQGHNSYVLCLIQLIDGRLITGGGINTIKIWNIMSMSQQKWIRRRLLVLLSETSKILSDPPELAVIRQEQYPSLLLLDPARRQGLELLLRCSLNISNNDNNNKKAFNITLTVLSMPEITIWIAEYL